MNPSFKAIAVTLVAGVIAGSVTACSKDLPTGPADKAQAGASLKATPLNDDFRNAVVVTGLPFTHRVNTSEARTAHDDPPVSPFCGFPIGEHTVWYQFSPTEATRINVTTVGSDFDFPGVAVYTGTRGDLTFIACNNLPNSTTFDALAGETYFIMVGSDDGAPGGNLVFTVDVGIEVSLTIDPVGTVTPDGVATITGTVSCSQSAFFELGGSIQQRSVVVSQGGLFASSGCDGVTRWEAQAVGENGRLKSGSAQVSAGALFTADATTEERHAGPVTATVRLRNR